MKEKKKKRGGQRVGAGRKPTGKQNEAVTVYTDVSRFGGKAGCRIAIYQFLDGAISKTGETKFMPLDLPDPEKKLPPSGREIKQKAPTKEKRPVVHLNKPIASLGPQEQPKADFSINSTPKAEKSNFEQAIANAAKDAILKEIEAIGAEKIPKERDTLNGRKSWQMDQQKRIQELQAKLK